MQSLIAKFAEGAEFQEVNASRTATDEGERRQVLNLAAWELALLSSSEIHFGNLWYVCFYITMCKHKNRPDFYPVWVPQAFFNGIRIMLLGHNASDFGLIYAPGVKRNMTSDLECLHTEGHRRFINDGGCDKLFIGPKSLFSSHFKVLHLTVI